MYYDGRFEESLELLNRSLENIPYELKALIVGGHALVELKRYVEAIDYYDRALNINPRDEGVVFSKKTATELLLKEEGRPIAPTLNEEERKLTERQIKKKEIEKMHEELKKEKDSQRKMYDYSLENKIQNQPSIKSSNSMDNTKSTMEIVGKVTSKTIDQTVDQINTSEFSSEFDERFDSAVEQIPDRAVIVAKNTAICAGTLCFLESENQDESLLDYAIEVNPQISSSLNYYIPTDTKDVSEIWLDGGINNTEFLTSTTYFIREQGKTRMISFEILKSSQNIDEFLIPAWLKNNVFWWINGYISDQEFINGLEYLIDVKIIKLLLIKTKLVGI